MATKAQLAKIHIAKKQLGLKDEEYSAILNAYDVTSSKDLTITQAEDLIEKLKKLGFKPAGKNSGKYSELKGRDKYYATPKQLRTIEWLWHKNSRSKTPEGLRKFIERATGKSHITFLEKEDASKVIIALKKL